MKVIRTPLRFEKKIPFKGDVSLLVAKLDPIKKVINSYYVDSLYLDTSELDHYHSKIDGDNLKKKVRVRRYDNSNTYHHEIKYKQGDLSYKEKSEEFNYKGSFVENSLNLMHLSDLFRTNLIKHSKTLRVLYHRKSFDLLSFMGNPFRVTIDSEIEYQCLKTMRSWKEHEALNIVEFKYGKCDSDIQHLQSVLGVRSQPFSKYARGIEKCVLF